MKRVRVCMYTSIVLLSFAFQANAALVKIGFKGTIDQVDAGSYSVGQQVSGDLIYDTETSISSYPTGSSPFTTNFGGAVKEFELDNLKVDNVTLNILSQTSFISPVYYLMGFSMAGFDDSTGLRENLDVDFRGHNLLDNIYQVLANPDIADMSSATFGYTLQKVGLSDGFLQERFYGSIDVLTVTNVPLPASLSFFLSGMLSLIVVRKVLISVKA